MATGAFFFDLDGTLLPMDQEVFTKGYFRALAASLAGLGMQPKALTAAVWDGTRAMMKNDGRATNSEVFWARFEQITGLDAALCEPAFDRFYARDFDNAKAYTGENPLAAVALAAAKKKGRKVVLASNPVFPMIAQRARLRWVGLDPNDFDLTTAYETERFCKPNPAYYQSICQRIGLPPERCLMIGNDEEEDMYAASRAGMNCLLITDHALPSAAHPWAGDKTDFKGLIGRLEAL